MKKLALLFIMVGFIVLSISAQEAKTKKEKKREKSELEFAELDSLISSKLYRFEARKANPTGVQQVDLTTFDADLIINNDSVESYLPFFGRAYNVAYGGTDSGIKFETILNEYNVVKDTVKLVFNISFSAKSETDRYQCTLSVTSSGSATLSVTSNNRAFISYYGNIEPIKKK